ncbi:MAG: hypothetical protein LM591_01645 [Candidatus Korarchaeum sp.]|nr:hypothetical protein [Candidatus Korarchaeum sp.]
MLTRNYIFCCDDERKTISMLLLGLARLNGQREEMELWCGLSPELKRGFVFYEIYSYQGRRLVPLTDSEVTKSVVRALHGPDDPKSLSYNFRISLGYYYIKEGRPIYLKKDLYELRLRGVERGAILSLKFLKGMSRIGYDELVERIAERARESSMSSKLIYASYPDELSSCI